MAEWICHICLKRPANRVAAGGCEGSQMAGWLIPLPRAVSTVARCEEILLGNYPEFVRFFGVRSSVQCVSQLDRLDVR